jgi:hypothetical protein
MALSQSALSELLEGVQARRHGRDALRHGAGRWLYSRDLGYRVDRHPQPDE